MLALVLGFVAFAQEAPLLVHHQGRLLDATGDPVTGTHAVAFTLWSAATGGSSAWTETDSLTFDAGYFATTLGDGTALTEDVFGGDRWLAIAVDGGAEIARVPLTSVPYAIRARVAHDVRGGVADVTEVRIDGDTVITSDGAIDATAIRIDGTTVIDASGQLVAPIQGATLEGIGCADGTYPVKRAGAWACEAVVQDTKLSRADVRGFVTDTALGLAGGSTVGGAAIVTPATDQDTLAALGCTAGTYPARTGAGWACLDTIDPADLLSALACDPDQTVAWTGAGWDCATVLFVDEVLATQVSADAIDVTGQIGLGTATICDEAHEGALAYDFDLHLVTVCDGDAFVPVTATSVVSDGGALRWSDGTIAARCRDYRTPSTGRVPATADGLYWVDPDGSGAGAAFPTRCDMTTDGGGWTLIQRTVWAWSASSALRTNYATWRTVNTGNPGSGAFRVAGTHWTALMAGGEMMFTIRPRRADNGVCEPLYYKGTGGTLSVTSTATSLTGLTAPISMIAGTALSATDVGPSTQCVAPNDYGVPWFYTSCCSTCPTFQASYWNDEPHPMASYVDVTPDLFQRTSVQACGVTGVRQANGGTYEGLDSLEIYLR